MIEVVVAALVVMATMAGLGYLGYWLVHSTYWPGVTKPIPDPPVRPYVIPDPSPTFRLPVEQEHEMRIAALQEVLDKHRKFCHLLDEQAAEPDPSLDRHHAFPELNYDPLSDEFSLCAHGIHIAEMDTDRCTQCGTKIY